MSEASDFAAARRVPPAEAIAYMQGRAQVVPTFNAYALWQDEHSRNFTVSRLARADLLQALQGSLAKSVNGDLTRRDWIKGAEKLLTNAGWWGTNEVTDPRTGELVKTRFDHARLQLIFDTNVRQSQAAGQWQRMLRNKRTHPYARYVTMDDGRVRPEHAAWHNVTLPLDHPWWDMHRPPNGYRCRCRVVGVTQREYDLGVVKDRPGAALDTKAPVRTTQMVKQAPPVNLRPWENPATGQIQYVPEGIDPGFDYNPGTAGNSKAFDDLVQAKLARLSPPVAKAARDSRLATGLPGQAFEGQRPGLFDLPDVGVPSINGDAFGPGLSRADLVAAAGRELQALQRAEGLVNNDAGWLLAASLQTADQLGTNAGQARAPQQVLEALRELVRQAVVVERQAAGQGRDALVQAVYRLLAPLQVDGQLYRVRLTVKQFAQDGDVRQLLHALDSIQIDGAPLAGTGRRISVAELLRGATRQDGKPFMPE